MNREPGFSRTLWLISSLVGVVGLASVRCASPDVASILPPEPAGMRVPANSNSDNNSAMWLRSLQCDSKDNKVRLEIEGGPGFRVVQTVNHDGKKILSVRSTFSRTPSAEYNRALQFSSGPAWSSWPGAAKPIGSPSPTNVSYEQIRSKQPTAKLSAYDFTMVSLPLLTPALSVQTGPIVLEAPIPAWRNWPVEEAVLETTFNDHEMSRALFSGSDGRKRTWNNKQKMYPETELAVYMFRAFEMRAITQSAVGCCRGSIEEAQACTKKIEERAASGGSTTSEMNGRPTAR